MTQHCAYLPCSTLLALLVTGLVGCSKPTGSDQYDYEVPTWPALEKLTDEELMMPIGMSADHGDWDAVRSLVVADGFKAAVEEFASTPVPRQWATPERTAAKDKAAAGLRALIEAAEKGESPKELEALWAAYSQSISKVADAVGGGPDEDSATAQ